MSVSFVRLLVCQSVSLSVCQSVSLSAKPLHIVPICPASKPFWLVITHADKKK